MNKLILILMLAAMLVVWGCADSDNGTGADDSSAAETGLNGGDDDAVDSSLDFAEDEADAALGKHSCQAIDPPSWSEPDLLSGPSVISYDSERFLTVNGQRFFPLGFYRSPLTSGELDTYKSEGFNIGYNGPGCCSGDDLQEQIDLLNLAAAKGVMMILKPWRPTSQVMTRTEAELEAELTARSGIGSLFGWYNYDEPGLHMPEFSEADKLHEILTTYDPNHLDTLVEAPNNSFDLYVDYCSFFMVDPYPSNWMPLVYIKAVMNEAQEAAGTKPVLGVFQAFSWDWYEGDVTAEYHPDAAEVRNMVWQFIIHGARGLLPWNYSGDYTIHAQPEIWESFLLDVAEINKLMSVLLSDDVVLDLAPESDFPTLFDYLVKQDQTATWLFTVSASDRILPVSLDLTDIGEDLCIVDYTTGETFVPDADGRIDVHYDPNQVRILEVIN